MKNATKATVSTFGAIAALAGLEHGIGETLQGNTTPGGWVIQSWPGSAFFDILAGEPAMTIVPNLLVTGILAILVSLIFLVWATLFVHRKHGGLVLIQLSIALLLVGGGFGPPLLGIITGATATRINAPMNQWRFHLPAGLLRFLGESWLWSFRVCLIAWLFLFPGSTILAYFFGVNDPSLIAFLFFFALGTLLLTILSGFAHDIERRTGSSSVRFDSRAI